MNAARVVMPVRASMPSATHSRAIKRRRGVWAGGTSADGGMQKEMRLDEAGTSWPLRQVAYVLPTHASEPGLQLMSTLAYLLDIYDRMSLRPVLETRHRRTR